MKINYARDNLTTNLGIGAEEASRSELLHGMW